MEHHTKTSDAVVCPTIGIHVHNKAIRDGKYLAPPHASDWQRSPENFDILSWRNFSARLSFYIINWYGYARGSHEKKLQKLSVQFLRHAIELLHVKRRTRHKWR